MAISGWGSGWVVGADRWEMPLRVPRAGRSTGFLDQPGCGGIVSVSARIDQVLGSARMRSVDSGCMPYSHFLTQGVSPIPVVKL